MKKKLVIALSIIIGIATIAIATWRVTILTEEIDVNAQDSTVIVTSFGQSDIYNVAMIYAN